VSAATQTYYASFDAVFFKLPIAVRARIEAKIDEVGARLDSFPHHRLKGSNRFRLRVGDYRIIYAFNVQENTALLRYAPHRPQSALGTGGKARNFMKRRN
jgi:mRNA-degrading endonuclease RelE of RelBE toxin-antitoxin system